MKQRAPDPRTARTRAAILAATDALLSAGTGAGTVSVAQIARQAGVSVGSVYIHFDSKDELIAQLIRLAWDRRRGLFEATRDHELPLDRVFAFGDALLEFARTEPVAFRALRLRALDPPDGHSATERSLLSSQLALLEADLDQALAQGEIGETAEARTVALLLFATWSGIAEQQVRRDGLGVDQALIDAARQLGQSVLAAGLRPVVVAA